MIGIATTLRWLRRSAYTRRVQLALCLRVTMAAVLTLLLAQAVGLPLYIWAVLTAVILTQVSFGRSLKATIDYLIGTLGGVLFAGGVGVVIPHTGVFSLAAVLALAVAPVALLAALRPAFAAAPFTAVLVILAPTLTQISPIESAFYRLLEVLLGGGAALAVSLFIFPARAHNLTVEGAAKLLDQLARALPALMAGFTQRLGVTEIDHIQNSLGEALAQLEMIGVEARRERLIYLAWGPDPGPLLRTLIRLRHDLIMIGRAAIEPLPEAFQVRLGPSLSSITTEGIRYLHESAVCLLAHRDAPPLNSFEQAMDEYSAGIDLLRGAGLTRALPSDVVERIFALGFALEQLRWNLRDLRRAVAEAAHSPIRAADRLQIKV
jgi:uncharacterized membrane protein YccC